MDGSTLRRRCRKCGAEFTPSARVVRRGLGWYCSRACRARTGGGKHRTFTVPESTKAQRIRANGLINKRLKLGWFKPAKRCQCCRPPRGGVVRPLPPLPLRPPRRASGRGAASVSRLNGHQPPFPWFGGKSAVADRVWAALGDVPNYVEPFAGSCAVLLLRPGGAGHIETVNDADGLLANFWRSLQADPDGVAEHADNPVNEADLHARHLWLLGEKPRITERLMGDPDFFDAKAAGWWVWGQCCWIGSGWCSGKGPWTSENGELVLRNPGQGVNRQLPHLGDPGKAPTGNGERAARSEWLRGYLNGFADRLRNVRVCCGDWLRVCGPSVTFRHGPTGVFLDPPYADTATRTNGLYAHDCEQVAHAVREWAIEQGRNPLMRIVLAGYQGEHQMPDDWRVEEWEAVGGYGLIADDEESTGRANKGRERLWLSPACVVNRLSQGVLFGVGASVSPDTGACPRKERT